MRVVFDTNLVVSACFWRGAPFECLSAWVNQRFAAWVSPPLLAEYEDVYLELAGRYPDRTPVNWVAVLAVAAELNFPNERVAGATPDPDDELVLECALAADADYLVSGDKRHLLPLVRIRGVRIVDPATFLHSV